MDHISLCIKTLERIYWPEMWLFFWWSIYACLYPRPTLDTLEKLWHCQLHSRGFLNSPHAWEHPEGSWTQTGRWAGRTWPAWRAGHGQGTAVQTAQPEESSCETRRERERERERERDRLTLKFTQQCVTKAWSHLPLKKRLAPSPYPSSNAISSN